MNIPNYPQFGYVCSDLSYLNGLVEVDNPLVGYNWYQSHPSSEGMAASPLHYPVEYRPSEPPPMSSHGNSPDFTFNPYYSPSHMLPYAAPPPSPNLHTNCAPYMYTPPFTLPCQTTLSTGQTYYTHESTAPVTTTTTIVDSPKLMDTPLTSATSVKGNQWEETLTKIMAILDRMQERCAVRSNVDDKTIQDEVVIGDGSRLGETVVEDEDNLQVDVLKSGRAVVGTVGGNDQADNNKLVKEAVEVQGELIVDAVEVEPHVFDKSPMRKSELVVETVSKDELSNAPNVSHNEGPAAVFGFDNMCNKLANQFEYSLVMDNLLIHQKFNSVTEYLQDFMHIKSRAAFIFNCDFADDLLAYCFVIGLKEEIREALELWPPQTLQEAVYVATFQESLLEEELLFEATKEETEIGECQAIIVKKSLMVHANSKEVFEVVEKKFGGLNDEFELQVESIVAVTNCVNELFGDVTKLLEMEGKVSGIGSSLKEVEEEVKLIAKGMPSMFILKISKMITTDLRNVGEKKLLIYDPGGGTIGVFSHSAKGIIFEVKVIVSDTHFRVLVRRLMTSYDGIVIFEREAVEKLQDSGNVIALDVNITLFVAYELIRILKLENIAYVLDDNGMNVSGKNLHILDSGGHDLKCQQLCVIHMFKEITSKVLKLDKVAGMKEVTGRAQHRVLESVSKYITPDINESLYTMNSLEKRLECISGSTLSATIKLYLQSAFSIIDRHPPAYDCTKALLLTGVYSGSREQCVVILGSWNLHFSIVHNLAGLALEGSMFNAMGDKGTRVSISTRGKIALCFFVSVVPPTSVTSGDSFELQKKLVLLYAHDEEPHSKLACDFDISVLQNVGVLTKHENSEENGAIELGLYNNEEFGEGACVGIMYGIEHTVAAWEVWLGTVATAFMHKLQQCILSWVSLKAIGVVKDKILAFRMELVYRVNHWPRPCGDLDEIVEYFKWERIHGAFVILFADEMYVFGEISLKFLTREQLWKEHPELRRETVVIFVFDLGRELCCCHIVIHIGCTTRYVVPDGNYVDADTPYAKVKAMKMCMPLLSSSAGDIHFKISKGQAMHVGEHIAKLDLNDSAVRKIEPFYHIFTILRPPDAKSEKAYQRCATSLNASHTILVGDGYNMEEVVQSLLSCYDGIMTHLIKDLPNSLLYLYVKPPKFSYSENIDLAIGEHVDKKLQLVVQMITIVKRLFFAWYWSVLTLVFDPGDSPADSGSNK